ncbi:cell growth regulator with EF hand domain protein 1 isoform X1 [Thamnophis elegans]|uniref:cell growth regulator with EF hand domain protein 1 isoform X1 n=1 Tax=Thamnophis elegans TaxID=35005 RepID=UPI00137836FE|nr:cell growth regulator with EF hand domain protein 1 isoform X1 [Thamnophis elegans]XP_032072868.1 cell growth regulator with EF hand domain protein 1 isoform X1 [Thamnophis elegans]XP_032072870.1 cell growth regulator with EF hand domain protein 1 isoform X1 [Thamnophis elegans]
MKGLFLAVWFFLVPAKWAAPKNSSGRPEIPNDSMDQPILNPLHPSQVSLKVLQDYLENIGQLNADTATMTREQALLLLFALHDYDKSGLLDGLEFMRLLNELVSQQAKGQPAPDMVVPMVDSILETQDFNWDGLLEPLELFLPPRQGETPNFLTAVSEEDGQVLWALPKPNGFPSPSDQQSDGDSPPAPEVQEQDMMGDQLWSLEKHGGELGQETAGDPDQQGKEMPSAPGD